MVLWAYITMAVIGLVWGYVTGKGAVEVSTNTQSEVFSGVLFFAGVVGFFAGIAVGIVTGSWIMHLLGILAVTMFTSFVGFQATLSLCSR